LPSRLSRQLLVLSHHLLLLLLWLKRLLLLLLLGLLRLLLRLLLWLLRRLLNYLPQTAASEKGSQRHGAGLGWVCEVVNIE
jgi:hypothetical protein